MALVHGLDDVVGRGDVQVAQVERVDRLALGGQRGGLGRDGEHRLGAELRDAVGGDEAAVRSPESSARASEMRQLARDAGEVVRRSRPLIAPPAHAANFSCSPSSMR